MLGYYKNEEATQEVIDKDGWLHTGDLALMDAEGNVTIKGRSKNLLLSASGQNIYPEEIEDKLNNLPYVAESIIVQQNEKLVGLVYPDFDDAFAHGLKNEDIEQIMEENRVALNDTLPAYSQISKMKIYPEEFEKTRRRVSNVIYIRKQKANIKLAAYRYNLNRKRERNEDKKNNIHGSYTNGCRLFTGTEQECRY